MTASFHRSTHLGRPSVMGRVVAAVIGSRSPAFATLVSPHLVARPARGAVTPVGTIARRVRPAITLSFDPIPSSSCATERPAVGAKRSTAA